MIFAIDLDDTLLNSRDLWETAFSHVFRGLGYRPGDFFVTRRKLPDHYYSLCEHVRLILSEKDLPLSLAGRKEAQMLREMEKRGKDFLFPDVEYFLKELRARGHYVVLVTFGKKKLQGAKLKRTGITKYFNEIIIKEFPKWEIIQQLQRRFPGEAVVFLDDHPKQLEPVAKYCRNVMSIRIMRKEGRYNKRVSKMVFPKAKDMRKVLDIISASPEVIHSDAKRIKALAISALKRGFVLVYPTDTIYGLGCDARNGKAKKKIYRIKGRPASKQLPVIMADMKMVKRYLIVGGEEERLLKKVWPGPVSVVLRAKKTKEARVVFDGASTGMVRIPENGFARSLSKMLGVPIVSTSTNISGKRPLNDPKKIASHFAYKRTAMPDIIVDGDILKRTKASTIVDLAHFPDMRIIRSGAGIKTVRQYLKRGLYEK
jgi:L-threonylcarbamoyladenylate synthase